MSKDGTNYPPRRWTDVAQDPNSSEALAYRNAVLSAAHRAPVPSRIDYIVELARGKRILDVGVVDHVAGALDLKPDWLHARISEVAAECLGVDVLEEGISILSDAGYNVKCLDITSCDLEGEFDLMVCGELIEHLDHPGSLFEAASRLLVPDGRMVITTPNPFRLGYIRHVYWGRPRDSTDHVTMLFPSGIAEMAERKGMRLDAYRGVLEDRRPVWRRWKHEMAQRVLPAFGVSEDAISVNMIYECVKLG